MIPLETQLRSHGTPMFVCQLKPSLDIVAMPCMQYAPTHGESLLIHTIMPHWREELSHTPGRLVRSWPFSWNRGFVFQYDFPVGPTVHDELLPLLSCSDRHHYPWDLVHGKLAAASSQTTTVAQGGISVSCHRVILSFFLLPTTISIELKRGFRVHRNVNTTCHLE